MDMTTELSQQIKKIGGNVGDQFQIVSRTIVPGTPQEIKLSGDFCVFLGFDNTNYTFNLTNVILSDRIYAIPDCQDFNGELKRARPMLAPGDGFSDKPFRNIFVDIRAFPDARVAAVNNTSGITCYFAIGSGGRALISALNTTSFGTNAIGTAWTPSLVTPGTVGQAAHSGSTIVPSSGANGSYVQTYDVSLRGIARTEFSINVSAADVQTTGITEVWVPTSSFIFVDKSSVTQALAKAAQPKTVNTQIFNKVRMVFRVRSVTGSVNFGLHKGYIDPDDGTLTIEQLFQEVAVATNGGQAGNGIYNEGVMDANYDWIFVSVTMPVAGALYVTGTLRFSADS